MEVFFGVIKAKNVSVIKVPALSLLTNDDVVTDNN
jgi:hypothetical protein